MSLIGNPEFPFRVKNLEHQSSVLARTPYEDIDWNLDTRVIQKGAVTVDKLTKNFSTFPDWSVVFETDGTQRESGRVGSKRVFERRI
jgi:hypothetical protein